MRGIIDPLAVQLSSVPLDSDVVLRNDSYLLRHDPECNSKILLSEDEQNEPH